MAATPSAPSRAVAPAPDDALACVLARSVLQRGAATAILQRKVGFEWEMNSIRPWLVKRGSDAMLVDALRLDEKDADDSDGDETTADKPPPAYEEAAWWTPDPPVASGDVSSSESPAAKKLAEHRALLEDLLPEHLIPNGLLVLRPVPRKHVLHQPQNRDWRLEADDTPGPWRSNVEYVTEPFDETPEGLRRFHQAIDEIATLVERLRPAAKRLGPGSDIDDFEDSNELLNLQRLGKEGGPYARILRGDESPETLFLLHRDHGLSGSNTVPAELLGLSGTGGAGVGGKLQATIGVDLGSLSQVMGVFGARGPTIGDAPTSLAGGEARENRFFQFLSAAPAIAALVADDLAGESLGPRGKLEGFLSALVVAVLSLSSNARDQLKYRFVLMPRTSHAAMFEALPEAHALRGRGAWLAAVIVHRIRESPVGAAIAADQPLLAGVDAAQTLTVERWIAAIVDDGKDLLLPGLLDELLR